MAKECEHKWLKLYKRKKQKWVTINDTFVCGRCGVVKELNTIKEVK